MITVSVPTFDEFNGYAFVKCVPVKIKNKPDLRDLITGPAVGADEFTGDYFASALGWGSELVAFGRNRDDIVAYVRDRFPGCEIN